MIIKPDSILAYGPQYSAPDCVLDHIDLIEQQILGREISMRIGTTTNESIASMIFLSEPFVL